MIRALVHSFALAAACLCLCGCMSGAVSYTTAKVAADATVPEGAQQTQIFIPIRIITLDPALVRTLGLGEDFGVAPGSLLTKAEAEKLLKSIQGVAGAAVLSAPQIMVFNGQAGNVRMMNDQPYISSYRFFGGAYEPMTDTIETGISVDAAAVAGAQPDSIALMLKVHFSILRALRSIPADNALPDQKLVVQRPVVDAQEIQTLAAVPTSSTLALMQPAEVDGKLVSLLVLATPAVMKD
jgi:hypothetical protein